MSRVECQATFDGLDAAAELAQECRAAVLDRAQPNCRCQHFSISRHSAGRVGDEEVLARILVAPQHMGKKGTPRGGALTAAENSGLSLFRESRTHDREIRAVAEGLVARARAYHGDKAGVFGVLLMRGATIRSIHLETEAPCYCLYDTGLVDSPGHAEIFQRVADVDAAVCEERRRIFIESVKDTFISVQDFRGGLLADLAPCSSK